MMPLKLIERVLPWLVGSLKEDEARDFLKNMQLAGLYFSNLSVLFKRQTYETFTAAVYYILFVDDINIFSRSDSL